MESPSLVDDVVFFGRYTTFGGETTFATLPVNVVAYDSLEIEYWRGPSHHANDQYVVEVQGSVDQFAWTQLASANIVTTVSTTTVSIDYPWLRVRVVVTAGDASYPSASGYVVGQLYRRR